MGPEARFWAKVDRDGPVVRAALGPCWVWTAGRSGDGYGAVKINGRQLGAHRASWEMENGRPVPPGLSVLHHCDNRVCVRPEHLYVGTTADNMRDKAERHRVAGVRNPRARLSESDVAIVRAEAAAGTEQRELARRFGVRDSAISKIVLGRAWSHIGIEERTG